MRMLLLILSLISSTAFAGDVLLAGYEDDKGVILFNTAQYQQAENYFRPHLKEGEPLRQLALLYLAKYAVLKNEGGTAVEYIEQSLLLPPNGTQELLLAAEAYCTKAMQVSIFKALALGKKCGAYYTRAAIDEPNNTQALSTAIAFHVSAPSMAGGSKKQAKSLLRQLEQVSEEAARSSRLLMAELEHGKKYALQQAVHLSGQDYTHVQYLYELAIFFKERGAIEEALKIFERVITMEAKTEEHWYLNGAKFQLGELYILRGSLKQGVALIEQYLNTSHDMYDPHYFWSRLRLAKAYQAEGKRDKSLTMMNAIASQDYSHDSAFTEEFKKSVK